MGYGLGTTSKDHRDALVRVLHGWRWSEELPEKVGPWSVNLMLETAVDEIRHLESKLAAWAALFEVKALRIAREAWRAGYEAAISDACGDEFNTVSFDEWAAKSFGPLLGHDDHSGDAPSRPNR